MPLTTVEHQIKCTGRRRDGRSCLTVLATVRNGLVVSRHAGREYVDPRSVRCDRCGTLRVFQDAIPVAGAESFLPVEPRLAAAS